MPMDLTVPLETASSLEANPPSPREPESTSNITFNNQEEDDDDGDLTGIEEIHDSEDEQPGMEADVNEEPQR